MNTNIWTIRGLKFYRPYRIRPSENNPYPGNLVLLLKLDNKTADFNYQNIISFCTINMLLKTFCLLFLTKNYKFGKFDVTFKNKMSRLDREVRSVSKKLISRVILSNLMLYSRH